MTSLVSSIIKKIAPIYPQAKRWLHTFNGGIFPKYYKELSANQPVREVFIPQKLIIPLQQQVGLPAELQVTVGDKVKKNQLLARSSKDANKALVVPIHAPTSGTIEAIEEQTLPHPSGLNSQAIILVPDGKHEAIDNVLEVSGETPESPLALKQIILDAGIIGMGGAGFPTYAKIPNEKNKIHTLLINGAECEPFITCDDLLMQNHAAEIIQGALITAQALGSNKIICGIETNKPSALKAMRKAAENTAVEIKAVQTVYPMGGQKQLTQELTGIEIPQKAHAVDLGMLMMNVATYSAIYHAVKQGEPLTSRMLSVTGLGLNKPFNIHALIGTPFIELANLAEPKESVNYPLVMGGPMMGFAVQDNQVPVIKTTNCILANPPEPVEMQMPCIRCGECMDACPVNLLPQQMYWHSQAHEFEKVEKLNVFDCIECGCCSYVCPSHIPLVQYYRNAKSEIKEIKAEEKAVELAKQRHEFKLARIEREKQEREARLKAKKEAVKKQAQAESSAKADESVKPKSAKAGASAAAAAAKAAAARRAAAKNKASSSTDTSADNIPPARKKAIEAAKKAASKAGQASAETSVSKTEKSDPKAAAKKAAMEAARKRAQTKKETDNETATADEVKDPKAAAKKAAMAAARKRAQAKKESEQAETPSAKEVKDPKAAAKKAAMEAARKRAAAKQAQVEKIEQEQTVDLTEQTEETAASKKEKARKAAMQAARAAAKRRKADSGSSALANPTNEQTEAASEVAVETEKSSEQAPETEDKKARAMRLAKEAAAKRAAKKRAENNNENNSDEENQ